MPKTSDKTPAPKTPPLSLGEALALLSPGGKLREAIFAILQSGNGALICIGDPKRLGQLSEGGVQLEAILTAPLLFELCKMDGAIILDEAATRILYANRFLTPGDNIPSDETGTRHRAAERLARRAKCLVIAVSERRGTVTLYLQDKKHVLDDIPTLLNKATQALQTLDKFVHAFEEETTVLTAHEFEDMVTTYDVCGALQRYILAQRIVNEVKYYLVQLGTEGRLVDMQLRHMLTPLSEGELLVRDYYRERAGVTLESVRERFAELCKQDLLEIADIGQALGVTSSSRGLDAYLAPRGYRILSLTRRLNAQLAEKVVTRFSSLQAILKAQNEELCQVEGIGEAMAEKVRLSLENLRTQHCLDRMRW